MMKTLILLTAALLATSCRSQDERDREAPAYSKSAETAQDDFDHTRKTYGDHVNARLEQLDRKIHELAARGGEKARQAADELRAERDRLAPKVNEIGSRAKAGWDEFESDLSQGFDEIERRANAAYQDLKD